MIPETPTAPRIAVYSNLNHPGISAMANPSGVTPPDSTGAIGPSHYVEMVNSQIAVWRRADLTNVSISSLHSFIGDPVDNPYCDPQVQWDPTAGRWLFLFLFCNTSSSAQGFIFGWSKTSDPSNLTADNAVLTSGWCAWGVKTDPSLFDYPKLGHNSKYVIFGGNFYDESTPSTNPPFQSAAIAWVAKPANGVTTCPAAPSVIGTTATLKNGDGVTNAFTPVPVNTMTGSADGYVVSAYDPSGSNGQTIVNPRNKLAVWHLDSSGALHQNSDITVASYAVPSSNAPQPGGGWPIDTLDGRLTQAVGDPTTGIWTQHTVDSPGGGRSVVRWYEIKVSGSTASLAQEGTISSATDWVFNGAISPRFDAGGAAIFYNRSSPNLFPVIAGQVRLTSTAAGAMEPGELLLASSATGDADFSCNFNNSGSPCRWGDYSGASPDPVQTNVVWGTNQYLLAFGGPPGFPTWDDENFAVVFVGSPTGVTAVAGDQRATVTWTPPTPDPGTPVTTYTINAYVGTNIVKSVNVPGTATSVIVTGLTDGVTYTFTVITNVLGDSSPESVHSNAVTPTRAAIQVAPLPIPPRGPVSQSSPAPSPGGR